MSASTVRVAVTQAEPAWLDLAAGVTKTCDLIAEAAKNEAKLIAFPECWDPGYPCWIWSRILDVELGVTYTYAIESTSFVLHCTALITDAGVEKMKTSGAMGMYSPGGGSSAVFGPDGRRLTEPVNSTTETIIYCDLDLDQIIATKLFADVTGHYSRPDLMSLNVCTRVKKMVCENEKADETEVICDLKNSK